MTTAIVVGAGGVGKTTVAASLAADGRSTLVLTVDPAQRLADSLGAGTLTDEPRPVAGTRRLHAAMLDAPAAWETVVRRHADAATAERLVAHKLFTAVAQRFPSGQAYAACDRMTDLVQTGRWDLVVVDTPPAEGGIDFFLAPARMADLVGGKVLRWLTGAHLPGRRRVFNWTTRPVLRLADSVLGGPFLQEVAEFLLDLRSIYDGLRRRARVMERLFHKASSVVVTTADPAPLAQAARFFRELPAVTGPPAALAVNKTLPAAWADAHPPAGTDAGSAANLRNWAAEAQRQQDAIAELQGRYGVDPIRIPWQAETPVTVPELVALAREVPELLAVVT
ncbi:MAG: ArsA family ATPase [Acidimicrobiia bacterium]